MDRPKSIASIFLILVLIIASIPYSIAEWVAVGVAPGKTGTYNVIIRATHEGKTETFPLQLIVNNTPYELDGLTVEPIYPLPRRPPIELKYDIKLNDSYDFEMLHNNLILYFASGRSLLKSEEGALTLSSDGYWYANVSVPFKGDYKAVVSVVVGKEGKQYGGDFVTHFSSDQPSPDLLLRHSLEKKILTPSESFEVFLEAEFEGAPLQYLEIFKANLYGSLKDLTWDRQDQAYDATFTAPTDEGVYLMSIYAEGQEMLIQDKVYVAEVAKAKSLRCPLAVDSPTGCDDMKDVRKCVYDYKSDMITVTEAQLIECFEAVTGGLIYGSIICNENWKGDFDGDENMDEGDLEILENMILPLTQSARKEYLDCADYDLDGDVDEEDLECLTNVVAGKWFGDENGGICFDAVYDSALKCDLDGDEFIDRGSSGSGESAKKAPKKDSGILEKIVEAADNGIEIPMEILETCDFNQDRKLNLEDQNCMKHFSGMDLDNPETLLSGRTIPDKCMKIYQLDNCQGVKGDINGDLEINALDEILIMMIEAKQIASYDMECADVNKDGRITTEDILCIKSYITGERDKYFICIGCDENLPTQYRHEAEICNDGYDNNCDGLVDRTSTGGGDMCSCNENTPCWYVYDADGGGSPGIDDGNVKVCRKVSWAGSGSTTPRAGGTSGSTPTGGAVAAGASGATGIGGYRWMTEEELLCEQGKECGIMECDGDESVCAFDGVKYAWYGSPAEMPQETDDPKAEPKLCHDGHDNDCRCGDVKCAKKKKGKMFKSPMFWIGAVVGVAMTFMGIPPIWMMGIQTGASIIGMVCKSPEMRALMSGLAIGISVGDFIHLAAPAAEAKAAPTSAEYLKAEGTYAKAAAKATTAADKAALTAKATKAAELAETAKAAEAAKALAGADKLIGVKSAAGGGGTIGTLTKFYTSKLGKIVYGAASVFSVMKASKFYKEEKAEWKHYRDDC